MAMPGLQRMGIEILAHGGDDGVGVGGGNALIFHRARQRVAAIQRDGAGFLAGIGVGLVLVAGWGGVFCGMKAAN